MKKQSIIVVIIFLFVITSLCGCTQKSDREKFIGIWYAETSNNGPPLSIAYEFISDETFNIAKTNGTGTYSVNGTWNLVNNKLVLTLQDISLISYYHFSNNDNTLTITDSNSLTIELKRYVSD